MTKEDHRDRHWHKRAMAADEPRHDHRRSRAAGIHTARIAITANDSLTPGTRLSHAAAFPVKVKRSKPTRTMT